ncbi:MAG: hypothetical protein HC824_22030 [Synechococcales cyanobacterium RM1_1_8]|nr:hypothetical protein [Synechococcales cyanobacterium RM1_1_8]
MVYSILRAGLAPQPGDEQDEAEAQGEPEPAGILNCAVVVGVVVLGGGLNEAPFGFGC